MTQFSSFKIERRNRRIGDMREKGLDCQQNATLQILDSMHNKTISLKLSERVFLLKYLNI